MGSRSFFCLVAAHPEPRPESEANADEDSYAVAWPFFSFALQEVGHANAAQDPAFGSITNLCGAMLSPRFAHLLSVRMLVTAGLKK